MESAESLVTSTNGFMAKRIQRLPAAVKLSSVIEIEQAPELYATWQKKEDGVTKIVIDTWADTLHEATKGKIV